MSHANRNWWITRLLAIICVICYSLNSQNFKFVLTPKDDGIVISNPGRDIDLNCRRKERMKESRLINAMVSEEIYYLCRDKRDANGSKKRMEFNEAALRWELRDDASNGVLLASEETRPDTDLVKCKWLDGTTVEPLEEAIISNLLLLFLCHIGPIVYIPYFAFTRRGKEVINFGLSTYGVVLLLTYSSYITIAQMGINYFWTLAATRLPVQTLATIFQSAIFIIYGLSIPILGEKATMKKSFSLVISFVGVVLASYYAPPAPGPVVTVSFLGLVFAFVGEISKSTYQVWFKWQFGNPDSHFVVFLLVIVALLHIIFILPLIYLADFIGMEAIVFDLSSMTIGQIALVILAVFVASGVNLGSLLVVALSSPTFWAISLTMVIPLSMALDFIFEGIKPTLGSCIGVLAIFVAIFLFYSPSEDNVNVADVQSSKDEEAGNLSEIEMKDKTSPSYVKPYVPGRRKSPQRNHEHRGSYSAVATSTYMEVV